MSYHAFKYGANAVCFKKNDKIYGMTCAWATQVDYDKVILLLGNQSTTGKNIKKADFIGISALSINQADIARKLGEGHSEKVNKLAGISYHEKDGAITIDGASRTMCVKVIDVLNLEKIEDDYLIYGLIQECSESNIPFLDMEEV